MINYSKHSSNPSTSFPKPGSSSYAIYFALNYFSQAISEEFGLIYYAEKNPELIGKDVSLIPMHINPKLSSIENPEIIKLRQARLNLLQRIGGMIHCF